MTMGSEEEDHATVYGEHDLDDDDSEDDELTLHNQHEDDELVDDDDDDSMSSAAGEVTIAFAGIPNTDPTATATTTTAAAAITPPLPRSDLTVVEKKKPSPMPLDESRRLFQRLWTDEDEIELLQGFLDYTTQRGTNNSSHHHHHDTAAFYDQIKSKLQLDFNKNQLVEKLRRLKKKYRNVLGKISSGKEYVFKSSHDQATFDISCKIWSVGGTSTATPTTDVGGLDDEEANFSHNPNPNPVFNLNEHTSNGVADPNISDKKTPLSRKRSRSGGVKIEKKCNQQQCDQTPVAGASNSSVPNLIEETVKSCFLPLFKEVLDKSLNRSCSSWGSGLGLGGMNPNHLPLSFNGGSANFLIGDMTDDKWRKQHILELEVYSKKLELVQDEIKSKLEELRSMGS